MAPKQEERVALAVDTAVEQVNAAHGDVLATTADEALELLVDYEPSANETRLFTRAWNQRQEELEDEEADAQDTIDEDIDDEVDAADADEDAIDPFAGDDEEVPEPPKMDDRRALAVERARELLGGDADTAAAEEAILALRHDGHEFYSVMRSSQAQATKFMRDYRKTQPGNNGTTSGRLSKSLDFQKDLQTMRTNLSTVRKTTEKGEARRLLEEVKQTADTIIAKVDESENA